MDESLWCLLYGLIVIYFDLNSVHGQINESGLYPFWRSKRQSCSSTDFRCASGQCIDSTALCDGAKDCNDGSDETSSACKDFRCPSFAFQCSYGGCVDRKSLCNDVADCVDRSDEDHPSCIKHKNNGNCKDNQFRCQNGKCIDSTLLCDGLKDCDDGSDETFSQCNNFRCPPFTFRCSYGGCIDRLGRCDGRPQCADSSDEDSVLCGGPAETKPSCKLPEKPEHGSFAILNCPAGDSSPLCQNIAGTVAPDFTILDFQCNSGYNLAGRSSNPCVNGAWANPHPTCVPVLCPQLETVGVAVRCSLNNSKVDCDKPMAPGTEALLACKIAYQLTNEPGYNKVICQSDGKWDKPVFTCLQECGKRNPDGKPFVSGGEEAKVGEFPWHIGIYRYNKEGVLSQICGGTLVNPDTVVSAAHCFWSETFKKTLDKSMFKVAAGKYYRDWNTKDEEMQESELSDIIIHDEYRGRAGLFRNDIAIVKLTVSVNLTWAVLPVCLDRANEYERFQLINGKTGTIVGWGVTEKNEASNELITTQLPFVDFSLCWDTVPETFHSYVTKDKFCAGYTNGTSVCPGDSGGGLAFEYNKRYYLRGIVSIGIEPEGGKKCFTDQYTAFTRVSDFLPWMEPYIR